MNLGDCEIARFYQPVVALCCDSDVVTHSLEQQECYHVVTLYSGDGEGDEIRELHSAHGEVLPNLDYGQLVSPALGLLYLPSPMQQHHFFPHLLLGGRCHAGSEKVYSHHVKAERFADIGEQVSGSDHHLKIACLVSHNVS